MIPAFLFLCACGGSGNPEKSEEITDGEKRSRIEYMSRDDLGDYIEEMEKSLFEDTVGMNQEKATKLMEAYAMYASGHPDDTHSPEYMFKAGELAMGLNRSLDALKYFSITYGRYVNFEKRPYALFLKAFVLENQVKDYDQATQTYKTFIEEYPDHPMRDDAEYSIQNMGKSPEELIKEFESRQGEEKLS